MGDWPDGYLGEPSNGVIGFWASAALDATLNTKRGWTQVIAITPFDCYLALAFVCNAGSPNGDFLIDIGVGTVGLETVIFPDFLRSVQTSQMAQASEYLLVPVMIPRSQRVAFRAAYSTASPTVQCYGYMIPAASWPAFQGYKKMLTHGVVTADSGGTSISTTASGIMNKGAWVEIAPSANVVGRVDGIIIEIGGQNNTSRPNNRYYIDIGIGATPGNEIIIKDYPVTTNAMLDTICPRTSLIIPCHIPHGTAIHARTSCNFAAIETFDIILHTLHR